MPPIHIGDSWTFDLQGAVMPLNTSSENEVVIGTLPAENYHGILTGRIRWTRPASGPIDLQIEMDVDGFSTITGELLPGGDEPGGFDSNIYPRYRIQTDESPGIEIIEMPFVAQGVMVVPDNCELRVRLRSHDPGYSAELVEGARLVMSVITIK